MDAVIHLLALLFARDGAALARTAPEPIDDHTAAHHVAAARVAAARHHVDADLLLAIAAHESHYALDARTPEVGGKVSCGVMTPAPRDRCDQGVDALLGYDAGAAHLREWIDATPDLHTALLGYAGGYHLIARCSRGPVYRQGGNHADLCSIADYFVYRAGAIRRARVARSSS